MTTIAEVASVAREERISRWLHVGPPSGTSANKVCVFGGDGIWTVVITDERAGLIGTSRREFDSESAAVEEALDSARMLRTLLT
jgi:hypothetical protein